MSFWAWVIAGIIAVFFVVNFIVCCPDLLPWNRRKKK
jgi:hypothetical protein